MIFLSFSSEDRDAALSIAGGLTKAGVPIWCTAVPGTIPHGNRPEHEVPAAIARCTAFAVLAVRPEFSIWVLDEIAEARERVRADRNFRIVPLLGVGIDPKRLPITIKNFEGLRLPSDPREMRAEHFAALSTDLRELVPAAAEPSAAPSSPRLVVPPPVVSRPAPLLDMVRIPAGTFLMGSATSAFDNERPVHEVRVPAFELARTPVTRRQWLAVMSAPPEDSNWSAAAIDESLPAADLAWDEARKFCAALSMREGLEERRGYRLPSEAEWEYACRAGTTTEYCSGDGESDLDRVGWYEENSRLRAHRVGEKHANPWGLFDMHGNVWEWCEDTWHDDYYGSPTDGSAWTAENWKGHRIERLDETGFVRVVRGGSYEYAAVHARSAYRHGDHRSRRWQGVGFRPARTVNDA